MEQEESAERTHASGSASEGEFRSGFVSLVGPANAGKSTLLNGILGTKVSAVSPRPQTTRNRILGVKHYPNAQIVFLDTPGFLSKQVGNELGPLLQKTTHEAAKESDFSVLVLDANRLQHDGVGSVEALCERMRSQGVKQPRIIALNKIDLVSKPAMLPFLAALGEVFGKDRPLEIVPICATKQDGVEALLKQILAVLQPGPPYFPEDQVTDQADEFFIQELIREKLFFELQEELPYSMAVEVERMIDEPTLLRIDAAIIVERESQKPIVVGTGGQKLKAIGTRARMELEKIFGVKVMLKLFVKVEEGWTKSAKGLRRAGY